MALRPPIWSASLLLLCSATTAQAQAQTPDPVTLSAAYTLQTESNLYRLPADANTQALLGTSSAAERIGITSLGLAVNKAYSLQRFELNLNLVDYRYQNFDHLSFTARNYTGAWRWSLTPRLHGNLTAERKETLNNFADYQGNSQRTQRNQRTDSANRFDAVYEIDGSWRALAGVAQQKQINQQTLLADSDYSANSAQVGVGYVFASGSSLTYHLKSASGSYLNRSLSAAGLYDDAFDQLDTDLRLHWLIDGKTSVDLSTTHISRTHPHFAQRDYSGLNASASLSWSLSAKTALSVGWARELSSYQTSYANYSQTDRFWLGPVWQLSPKAVLRLRYELAQRDYLGRPSAIVGLQRNDTTRDASVSFDWQPYQRLTLSASLQYSQRDSSLPGLDYTSNMATISAQYSY